MSDTLLCVAVSVGIGLVLSAAMLIGDTRRAEPAECEPVVDYRLPEECLSAYGEQAALLARCQAEMEERCPE